MPEIEMKKTAEEETQEAILETLAQLSGKRIGTDSIVKAGAKYQLPETTTLQDDIHYLVNYAQSMEAATSFTKRFRYRPWDGAACFQSALLRIWGTAGVGKAQFSFFGKQLPEMRTIDVGPNEQLQVPWGVISFTPLSATITMDSDYDRDYGPLFIMHVEAPKKYSPQVEGLFKLIELELQEHSIYKGKAFTGADEPSFIDPYNVDAGKIVYSEEVGTQLGALIWAPIVYTEACKDLDIALKRSALLHGPYGTGKSLAAQLTAQKAVENGWTFLQCRPGQDNLQQTLQTARLYQPAVVFFEDLDTMDTVTGKPLDISRLQDLFDGIQAKGTMIEAVHTTNFIHKIGQGMLRPGRLDAVIEIGPLDAEAFIKLVKSSVPRKYLPKEARVKVETVITTLDEPGDDSPIDWGLVAASMEGFLPAFVKETAERAKLYAVWRTGGHVTKLTTSDFVNAAIGLRPQLDLMNGAKASVSPDSLTEAMKRVMHEAVTSGEVALASDGSQTLLVPKAK